jgi:fimbrial chaperone protein
MYGGMMNVKRLSIMVFLIVLMVVSAAAFSFVPMSASIAPSGAQSVLSFKVTNDTAQSIAIVIKVMTRSMDIDGVESNQDVGKEFVVFPTRVVVQPNSFQTVKVQYKGIPNPPRELCYRVIAEQVPIDFTRQETSGVKVLFKYIAALYVTPPRVTAKLVIEKATGVEKDGVPGLNVVLKNEGTRHALISNPVLRIQESSSSMSTSFNAEQASAMDGQNILPASSRQFFVPWKDVTIGTTYSGTISADIE